MIRLDDLDASRVELDVRATRSRPVGRTRSTTWWTPSERAERRAAVDGEWVVLTVAYEAARLRPFDADRAGTARRHPARAGGSRSRAARSAPPLVHGESRVTSRVRRSNVLPFPAAVDMVRTRIAAGDVYQVNVTDRFEGRTTALRSTRTPHCSACRRARSAPTSRSATGRSPRRRPSCSSGGTVDTITCRPMKGTAEPRPRPDDDERRGRRAARVDKERAENVMIVDLLRNDLGRVARIGSVQVPELFTLRALRDRLAADFDRDRRRPRRHRPRRCPDRAVPVRVGDRRAEDRRDGHHRRSRGRAARGVLRRHRHPGTAGHGPGPCSRCRSAPRCSIPVTRTYEYGAGGGDHLVVVAAAEDAEVRAKARILTRSHRPLSLLETLRNDVRGLSNVEAHLDRLEASARWFGYPFDRRCDRGSTPSARAVDRRRADPGAARPRPGSRRRATAVARRRPTRWCSPSTTVVTRSDDPYCCHKTTWRRHYDEARRPPPAADDVVLVNEHGHAIETTIANLAYRIGDLGTVPPLSDGGLPGVGPRSGDREGRLDRTLDPAADLGDCDELAVVNDLRGWRRSSLG